jgi:cytochrome c oxidase assembly protein subunit 15
VHRYAVFTACCTLFLLLAGALVTSNDAGLAVPDWPTSYGSFFPPMVGGIFYEHGHRMVATFVGLVTIGLAALLWRAEQRRWMRWMGLAALGAVIAQGLLGGLTVLLRLPPEVSIAHATLAQTFFCIAVAIALFTGRWWMGEVARLDDAGSPRVDRLAVSLAGVAFLQLILGAALRHNALSIVPHLFGAGAVLVLAMLLSRATRKRFAAVRALRLPVIWVQSLVGAQILLGGAAWWSRLATRQAPQPQPQMIWLTAAHTVFGALVLAGTVVLALVCRRMFTPVEEPAVASGAQRAHV